MLQNASDSAAQAVIKHCQYEPKAVHYCWSGGVTAGGQSIDFAIVKSITIHRDYVSNFADEMTIEVMMDTKKYFEYVCRNQDNLEVYLRKRQMAENSTLFVAGGENILTKYKAFLLDPPKIGINTGVGGTTQVSDPDQTVTMARFQLIDYTALQLRLSSWQGLMEKTKPSEALAMILVGISEDLGAGTNMEIEGVHAAQPDNKKEQYIIIPQGTPVKDMAQFIQQEYGIYNFGIGSFVQGSHWFVYPLFNNNRYNSEQLKMAISIIDKKNDFLNFPRTYVVSNYILTVISSSDTNYMDNSASDQLMAGTGIRVVNSLGNNGEHANKQGMHDNQVMMDGSIGMNSFNVVQRKDGMQNVNSVYSEQGNMYHLVSSVSGNQGRYITIKWEFAKPELVQPGMPVRIAYLDGTLKTLYGTVHEVVAGYARATPQFGDVPFICTAMLKIYVTDNPSVAI